MQSCSFPTDGWMDGQWTALPKENTVRQSICEFKSTLHLARSLRCLRGQRRSTNDVGLPEEREPVWRPVPQDCTSEYILDGQRTPYVRIIAVVAVVAHHKNVVGWYSNGLHRVRWTLECKGRVAGLVVHQQASILHLHTCTCPVQAHLSS